MTQPQFQIVSIQEVPTRHAQSILCNSGNVLANIQNGQSFLQSCGKHIEWSKFSAILRQTSFIILNFLAILRQTLMFLQIAASLQQCLPEVCSQRQTSANIIFCVPANFLFAASLQQVCCKFAANNSVSYAIAMHVLSFSYFMLQLEI